MAEAFQLLDGGRRESGYLRAVTKDSSYVTLRSREPTATRTAQSDRTQAWKTTLWRSSPLLGLTALLLATGCIAASYWILRESNGQPLHEWDPQPSVYLSIATNAINILIRFAFGLAFPLAWWRSAIRGSTVASLHAQWSNGTSLYRALTSVIRRRRFGQVALAAVTISLIAISGPLLQRASFVRQQVWPYEIQFDFTITPELPRAWAGNKTTTNGYFTDRRVSDAIISFLNYEDMTYTANSNPCKGTCIGTILGPGLAKTCATTNQSYDPLDSSTLPYFTYDEYLMFAARTYSFLGIPSNSSLWLGPRNIVEPPEIPLPDPNREVGVLEIVVANNDGVTPPTVSATQCWVQSAILNYTIIVDTIDSRNTVRFAGSPINPPVYALANNTVPMVSVGLSNQTGLYNSIVNVMFDNAVGVFRTDNHRNSKGQWDPSSLNAFGMSHIVMLDNPGANGFEAINPLDDLMASFSKYMYRQLVPFLQPVSYV